MKNLKRGDRVRFLNDTGSGTITRLIDNEMVMVRTDEGFEYPVMRNELLKSAPGSYDDKIQEVSSSVTEKEEDKDGVIANLIQAEEDPLTDEERFENIFLAIVPVDLDEPVGGEIDIYLINDSNYNLIFLSAIREGNKKHRITAHGYLESETKYLLGNYHMDDIFSDTAGIRVNLIAFRKGFCEYREPVDFLYNPPKDKLKTYGAYKVNEYTDGKAILVNIIDAAFPEQSVNSAELKEALLTKDTRIKDKVHPVEDLPGKNKKTSPEEVDLHINEIIENAEGLSAGEIVEIQMARFKTALDGAIINSQKRITFIHGIGAGKLKHEIRKTIDRDYPRCRYQDASFKEYGYGATMVLMVSS